VDLAREADRAGTRGGRPDVVLRDTENHDGRGVHDADDDPGEPDGPIGKVSPIIGKVPERPVVCTPQRASRTPRGGS
jgi:hypothetical protein